MENWKWLEKLKMLVFTFSILWNVKNIMSEGLAQWLRRRWHQSGSIPAPALKRAFFWLKNSFFSRNTTLVKNLPNRPGIYIQSCGPINVKIWSSSLNCWHQFGRKRWIESRSASSDKNNCVLIGWLLKTAITRLDIKFFTLHKTKQNDEWLNDRFALFYHGNLSIFYIIYDIKYTITLNNICISNWKYCWSYCFISWCIITDCSKFNI